MNPETELKQQLDDFNLNRAIEVSDMLHDLETQGQELSDRAERLWCRLTRKIMKAQGARF